MSEGYSDEHRFVSSLHNNKSSDGSESSSIDSDEERILRAQHNSSYASTDEDTATADAAVKFLLGFDVVEHAEVPGWGYLQTFVHQGSTSEVKLPLHIDNRRASHVPGLDLLMRDIHLTHVDINLDPTDDCADVESSTLSGIDQEKAEHKLEMYNIDGTRNDFIAPVKHKSLALSTVFSTTCVETRDQGSKSFTVYEMQQSDSETHIFTTHELGAQVIEDATAQSRLAELHESMTRGRPRPKTPSLSSASSISSNELTLSALSTPNITKNVSATIHSKSSGNGNDTRSLDERLSSIESMCKSILSQLGDQHAKRFSTQSQQPEMINSHAAVPINRRREPVPNVPSEEDLQWSVTI